MTTFLTTASSITSALTGISLPFPTTTFKSPVPQFTPDPACIQTNNLWEIPAPCPDGTNGICLAFHLGNTTVSGYQSTSLRPTCLPSPLSQYPMTQCPVSYTPARTIDDFNSTGTYRTLACCPTAFNFTYTPSTAVIATTSTFSRSTSYGPYENFEASRSPTDASGYIHYTRTYYSSYTPLCEATSPPLLPNGGDGGGSGPYILNRTASAYDVGLRASTATFDPAASDVLYAEPVTVTFEVRDTGETCAPDCAHAWDNGPWPYPAPWGRPNLDHIGSRCEGPFCGSFVTTFLVLVTVLPILGFLSCVGCCVCCCVKGRRKKRAELAALVEERARREEAERARVAAAASAATAGTTVADGDGARGDSDGEETGVVDDEVREGVAKEAETEGVADASKPATEDAEKR